MKRLAALVLAVFAATQADGQGSAAACWLGASFTTCFKPVIHTSVEGPASTTVSGYLASADWAAFNSGLAGAVPSSRIIATTAPLAGGGNLTADRTLSIPAATVSANGYLSSVDWAAFNQRVTQGTTISTTSPLAGGGDLSANRTLSITQANLTTNGYLASADWATFNSRVITTRNVSTTAPLAGGGALSSDLTLSIPAATVSANGYLTSADWGAFNGGGRVAANLTTNGYLASADWAAFNGARVDASASNRGMVNTATQTLGGVKTFNSGIAFTQTNASGTGVSSTGATLNDYEEGTWTPIAATSGTSFSSVTYTTNGQQGRYTRNGRIVCIQAYMQWSATTGSPTGNLGIGQLPFSAANVTNLVTPLATTADNIAYPAGFTSATAEVQSNNNVAYLIATENNVGATNVLAASNTGGTRSIRIAGCYSL